jgi:uncharacterized lipoprotein YajG
MYIRLASTDNLFEFSTVLFSFPFFTDEKVPATQKILQQRADMYLRRVEQLKTELANAPAPHVAAMGSSVDGAGATGKEVGDEKTREEIEKLEKPPMVKFNISKEIAANIEPSIRKSMVGQGFAIGSSGKTTKPAVSDSWEPPSQHKHVKVN